MSKELCPHVHHAASKHFDAASGCLCSSFAPASSDLAPTPCLSSISTSSSSCQVLQLNDSCRRCSFYGICFIWAHWKFERTAKTAYSLSTWLNLNHLLAFLFCRRCNFPSSWCLSRRQPCPPYSPSRLWPLLRSHQVPLIPWTDQSLNIFSLNIHFSDCKVKWNDHPVKWMFSLPPSAVA